MSCRAAFLSKVCVFSILTLAVVGCRGGGDAPAATPGKGGGKKGGGETPVTVVKAAEREVPMDLDVIGNVEASSVVTIKPQVSGMLTKVHFKEGDFVKAGQTLFEIDRRTIEAQLQQATANLARSEALNRAAQANLLRDQAQLQYLTDQANRYAKLAEEGVFSKEQAQQTAAQAKAQTELVAAGRANIESSRADVAAVRATIENLKVQLSFTTIVAPITGRTGTLLVKQGNVVSANATDLVTIMQIQPVQVSFAIPESQLKNVSTRFGKERIEVYATAQDGSDPHTGLLTFFENAVDTATGTIRLRGTFPNTDLHMWPGEFVRVRMRLGLLRGAVVLPNQAVQTGQDGQFVYVVKEDRSVESRPITTSVRYNQDLVIASGLGAGETVVLEGQLRLAPGMRVSIRQPGDRKGGGKGGAKGASMNGSKGDPGASAAEERAPRTDAPAADAPSGAEGKAGKKGFRGKKGS